MITKSWSFLFSFFFLIIDELFVKNLCQKVLLRVWTVYMMYYNCVLDQLWNKLITYDQISFTIAMFSFSKQCCWAYLHHQSRFPHWETFSNQTTSTIFSRCMHRRHSENSNQPIRDISIWSLLNQRRLRKVVSSKIRKTLSNVDME